MNPININNLSGIINKQTGCKVEVYPEIKGDTTICISFDCLKSVTAVLLASFDYCHLSAITVQKRDDKNNKVDVLYSFWVGQSLSLMMELTEKPMRLPSIISLIPGADFYEREAAEMFGIEFTGREKPPHLLLPDNWDQGPPFMSSEENNG